MYHGLLRPPRFAGWSAQGCIGTIFKSSPSIGWKAILLA
jgi:hypothetical protein